jgi:hypothetical protein
MIVKYNNKLYPGEFKTIDRTFETINDMEPTINRKFRWSSKNVHQYPICDIVQKMNRPVPCDSRGSRYIFPDFNTLNFN